MPYRLSLRYPHPPCILKSDESTRPPLSTPHPLSALLYRARESDGGIVGITRSGLKRLHHAVAGEARFETMIKSLFTTDNTKFTETMTPHPSVLSVSCVIILSLDKLAIAPRATLLRENLGSSNFPASRDEPKKRGPKAPFSLPLIKHQGVPAHTSCTRNVLFAFSRPAYSSRMASKATPGSGAAIKR